jgi:hypothetical protein
MARGGHGLPKVSPGPIMPYLFMHCRPATPEKALHSFQQWPATDFYPLGHPTPYAYARKSPNPKTRVREGEAYGVGCPMG